MNSLRTRFRITFGLVCVFGSVLLVAMVLQILPDRRRDVLAGRATLCEAVAVNASVLVTQQDLKRLEAVLTTIVKRKPTILSAAVRRADGKLLVEIGHHHDRWQPLAGNRSTETQVQVPVWSDKKRWGVVEMRFAPLDPPGWLGVLSYPEVRLFAFFGAAGFLLAHFYLGRMLRHLDPSQAVPGHVRSALDTLAEGLLILDTRGRIVLANRAVATMLDVSPKRLLGAKASTLPWCASDQRDASDAYPWMQVLRGAGSAHALLQLEAHGGEQRTCLVNCSAVRGSERRTRGVLVSLDDVTQLKEQELALRRAKDQAESANRAKSSFLANISHEIRTPINAVLGFTDMLRRGLVTSEQEQREHLDTIFTSGQFLLELINDTLDLSKIEAGALEVERIACSPHRIIREVVDVLKVRAEQHGITLRYTAEGPIPQTIQSDPVRLRQILTNLVGNAIKFTEQGGVQLVARLIEQKAAAQLAIDVIDTGIGIPADRLESIFDPFVQADASTTRRFGGTGLGLAISRQLAEALGGGLTVQSRLGQGSTFTVTVDTGPLEGVERLELAELEKRCRSKPKRLGKLAASLEGARILVVDDAEANRKLIRVMLGRAGALVQGAGNGREAVERASREAFDLIFMDMQMPVMDGYAATARLREMGLTVPIIALTANATPEDDRKCRQAGCTEFLPKPVNLDALMQITAAHLAHICPAPKKPEAPARDTDRRGSGDPAEANDRVRRGSHDPAERNDRQVSPASKTRGSAPSSLGQPMGEIEGDLRSASVRGRETCAQRRSASVRGRETCAQRRPVRRKRPPLVSSLPMDDPEFRQIVRDFLPRLKEQIRSMHAAWQQCDLERLAGLAHWLKGSGGTVGLDAFTDPAQQLEQSAKTCQQADIERILREITDLADLVVVPEAADASTPPAVPIGGQTPL